MEAQGSNNHDTKVLLPSVPSADFFKLQLPEDDFSPPFPSDKRHSQDEDAELPTFRTYGFTELAYDGKKGDARNGNKAALPIDDHSLNFQDWNLRSFESRDSQEGNMQTTDDRTRTGPTTNHSKFETDYETPGNQNSLNSTLLPLKNKQLPIFSTSSRDPNDSSNFGQKYETMEAPTTCDADVYTLNSDIFLPPPVPSQGIRASIRFSESEYDCKKRGTHNHNGSEAATDPDFLNFQEDTFMNQRSFESRESQNKSTQLNAITNDRIGPRSIGSHLGKEYGSNTDLHEESVVMRHFDDSEVSLVKNGRVLSPLVSSPSSRSQIYRLNYETSNQEMENKNAHNPGLAYPFKDTRVRSPTELVPSSDVFKVQPLKENIVSMPNTLYEFTESTYNDKQLDECDASITQTPGMNHIAYNLEDEWVRDSKSIDHCDSKSENVQNTHDPQVTCSPNFNMPKSAHAVSIVQYSSNESHIQGPESNYESGDECNGSRMPILGIDNNFSNLNGTAVRDLKKISQYNNKKGNIDSTYNKKLTAKPARKDKNHNVHLEATLQGEKKDSIIKITKKKSKENKKHDNIKLIHEKLSPELAREKNSCDIYSKPNYREEKDNDTKITDRKDEKHDIRNLNHIEFPPEEAKTSRSCNTHSEAKCQGDEKNINTKIMKRKNEKSKKYDYRKLIHKSFSCNVHSETKSQGKEKDSNTMITKGEIENIEKNDNIRVHKGLFPELAKLSSSRNAHSESKSPARSNYAYDKVSNRKGEKNDYRQIIREELCPESAEQSSSPKANLEVESKGKLEKNDGRPPTHKKMIPKLAKEIDTIYVQLGAKSQKGKDGNTIIMNRKREKTEKKDTKKLIHKELFPELAKLSRSCNAHLEIKVLGKENERNIQIMNRENEKIEKNDNVIQIHNDFFPKPTNESNSHNYYSEPKPQRRNHSADVLPVYKRFGARSFACLQSHGNEKTRSRPRKKGSVEYSEESEGSSACSSTTESSYLTDTEDGYESDGVISDKYCFSALDNPPTLIQLSSVAAVMRGNASVFQREYHIDGKRPWEVSYKKRTCFHPGYSSVNIDALDEMVPITLKTLSLEEVFVDEWHSGEQILNTFDNLVYVKLAKKYEELLLSSMKKDREFSSSYDEHHDVMKSIRLEIDQQSDQEMHKIIRNWSMNESLSSVDILEDQSMERSTAILSKKPTKHPRNQQQIVVKKTRNTNIKKSEGYIQKWKLNDNDLRKLQYAIEARRLGAKNVAHPLRPTIAGASRIINKRRPVYLPWQQWKSRPLDKAPLHSGYSSVDKNSLQASTDIFISETNIWDGFMNLIAPSSCPTMGENWNHIDLRRTLEEITEEKLSWKDGLKRIQASCGSQSDTLKLSKHQSRQFFKNKDIPEFDQEWIMLSEIKLTSKEFNLPLTWIEDWMKVKGTHPQFKGHVDARHREFGVMMSSAYGHV